MTTKKATKAPVENQDVEGQGYLLDPVMARQITHDRQKDMERSTAERARQKEARPNKQRQP
ncbi:MAG TPA: hypothetical protein VMT36_00925 [Candidatus Saccharimonadia bacterium]|nr:hypothetical protein [Candidatus Saccharimonadia bacterium]